MMLFHQEWKRGFHLRIFFFVLLVLFIINTVVAYGIATRAGSSEMTQNYRENVETVIRRSEIQLHQYPAENNSYAKQYFERVISVYQPLLTLETGTEPTNGWDTLLNDSVPDVIIFIATVYLTVYLFGDDTRIHASPTPILRATKKGRRPLALCRIAVIGLLTLSLSFLFFFSTFLGMNLTGNLRGANAYLQRYAFFRLCPYAIRVWQAVVLMLAGKTLLFFAIALLTGVITCTVKNRLLSLSAIAGFCGVSIVLSQMNTLNENTFFKCCNPVSALDVPASLEKLCCVQIANAPLSVIPVNLVLFSFLALMSGCLLLIQSEMRETRKITKRPLHETSSGEGMTAKWSSLLTWECRKVFSNRKIVFALCFIPVLSVIAVFVSLSQSPGASEKIYADYIQTLRETDSDTWLTYLAEEEGQIEQGELLYADYKKQLSEHGSYDGDAEKAELAYYYSLTHADAFQRVKSACIYQLSREDTKSLTILYDSGWMRLFESGNDYLLLLFSLMLSCFVGSFEYATGMGEILTATKCGTKKDRQIQMRFCLLAITGMYVFCSALRALPILLQYDLPNSGALLVSLAPYQSAPNHLSLVGYLCLLYFVRWFTYCLMGIFALSLARTIHNSYLSLLVSLSLLGIPEILFRLGIKGAQYLRLMLWLNGNEGLCMIFEGSLFPGILPMLGVLLLSLIFYHNFFFWTKYRNCLKKEAKPEELHETDSE